jgi:Fe-S-cluster containining protein
LTEDLDPFRKQMKASGPKRLPRCVALTGKLGERVGCSIYENRPTPCRQFAASYENGERNPRCDEARQVYGMPPLRPQDFAE